MKSPYVDTLVPNETVTAQFLVLMKEIRQKKTGEPYLSLHLADRTGEIEARMWDNVAEVMNTFERDHFVKVKGLAQVYNNRSQFTIHKLRRLEDREVDFADFFPCSERASDEMFAELTGIIDGIGNSHLRELLVQIFADSRVRELYKVAPAAKSIHHACRGGLLEHVLSLCTLGRLTASHYPEVDRDLLTAGIILHDIGKVEELTYDRSFGYSVEGQLLGHIILGLRLVGTSIDRLAGFPPKLRTLLEHMILSHHGELEFGSPKVPLFPEAMLLHHIDNLDSKMNAMRSVLNRDRLSTGEFTAWVPSLERVLLRKEIYMSEQRVALPHPEKPPMEEKKAIAPAETAPADTPTAPSDQPRPAVVPGAINQPVPQAPAATAATPPIVAERKPQSPPPSPSRPAPAAPVERKHDGPPHRPQMNTVFADKLQAVLDGRK